MRFEKPRCGPAFVAFCFAIVFVGCLRATAPTGPLVNGKTLRQWTDEAAVPLKPDRFVNVHHREIGARRQRTQALKILGLIGPETSDGVPLAIELLESDYYDMRAEAAAALGGFGVGDRKVVEALVASLDREVTSSQRDAPQQLPGSGHGLGGVRSFQKAHCVQMWPCRSAGSRPAVPAIHIAIERGDFADAGDEYLKKIDPDTRAAPRK